MPAPVPSYIFDETPLSPSGLWCEPAPVPSYILNESPSPSYSKLLPSSLYMSMNDDFPVHPHSPQNPNSPLPLNVNIYTPKLTNSPVTLWSPVIMGHHNPHSNPLDFDYVNPVTLIF